MSEQPTHYLALTIGPIQRTIQRARKTRELWAASFLLSQFMKNLLVGLQPYGDALSPDITELNNQTTYHGAGIWNDNCSFRLHDDKVESLKLELPSIIQKAKSSTLDFALFGLSDEKKDNTLPFSESELRTILSQHFHCHAALLSREEGETEPILGALGQLTAAAQMRKLYPPEHDDFVSVTMFRSKAVRNLYKYGFEKEDGVFTFYGRQEKDRRLPSLLEIGVREFQSTDVYAKIEDKISEKIKNNDDDIETDEENQEIIGLLKSEKLLKKRHKYIAIVQSDGDSVGTMISTEPHEANISTISKELMDFSKGAVAEIFKFDALPVYAGGDDLLFISPLQNKDGKTVFELIQKIQDVFGEQIYLKSKGASLSFGVSVSYYKYPLGESLEAGRDLLSKVAKKLAFRKKEEAEIRTKKGLAFRFMLHSGQSFGAVLSQEGSAWNAWKVLLSAHNSSAGKDIAFVSGVVHSLERLGWLLDEACQNGRTEYFFKQHFNEAKGEQKQFIENVENLAKAIHADYQELIIAEKDQHKFYRMQLDLPDAAMLPNAEELRRQYCNNLLYSALRTIKFLNDADHE
jgi:CRISPR-associated protein Cmr2